MLSCLNDEGVEFILVGAYALAAHGLPRATGDIDVWVRNTPDNARKILRALARFGAPTSELSEEDFTTPDRILQLGVEPCRVDLLTGIDGVVFDEAMDGKVKVAVDGIEVSVLSKRDLLKNKLAAGRDKDRGDIAWLEKSLSDEARRPHGK
jgi:predicted nucleotidyltransferase